MTAPRASRAIISDPAGAPTTLTLFLDDQALAFVELDPATCVGLAGDLIEAARIRLGRGRDVPRVAGADRDEGGRQ